MSPAEIAALAYDLATELAVRTVDHFQSPTGEDIERHMLHHRDEILAEVRARALVPPVIPGKQKNGSFLQIGAGGRGVIKRSKW